ncbi:MAG: sigma-70 family RNA polymerase sigma factor [Planctomycetales bacterium]|nr:sigma-70 family RNA polymerase sigma factor [Planctomycetales bacterium]
MAFFNNHSDNLSLDDTALVRQCQRGNSEAMGCLIVKYQDRVYNTILKICQNRDDAAELTQDTFVKVLESIQTFGGRSSFYTWLFRVAVNLTLNYCRRRFKLSGVSLDAADERLEKDKERLALLLADPNGPDPAAIAQQRELAQIVAGLIGQLPQDYRVVLVLRDIEQMSYAHIAEVLDLEAGTVKSRLNRARTMLRELVETVLT